MELKLKAIQEQYPHITLRKFCETTGLCYQYLLKVSKQPIANQAYDPAAFNYEAVQRIIDKRFNPDDSATPAPAFNWAAIDAEALAGARKRVGSGTPANKQEEFTVGTEFRLREPKDTEGTPVYRVVYTTSTHIVFQYIDDTQPRVMNWDTFLHQSPRIFAPTAPATTAAAADSNSSTANTPTAAPVDTSVVTHASDPGSQQNTKTKKRVKKVAADTAVTATEKGDA